MFFDITGLAIPLFIVFWLGVALFVVRSRYRRRMRLRERYGQKDSKNRQIELSPTGKLGALVGEGYSPRSESLFQIGLNKPAPTSLNTTILRPSILMRLFSVGMSVLVLGMMWTQYGEQFFQVSGLIKIGVSALVLYAMLNMLTYEARYERQTLHIPNWAFQQREFNWKDLVSIKDNGHYLYVLRFSDGRKAELQKFLVGIPEFLSYAQDRINENTKDECPNYQR